MREGFQCSTFPLEENGWRVATLSLSSWPCGTSTIMPECRYIMFVVMVCIFFWFIENSVSLVSPREVRCDTRARRCPTSDWYSPVSHPHHAAKGRPKQFRSSPEYETQDYASLFPHPSQHSADDAPPGGGGRDGRHRAGAAPLHRRSSEGQVLRRRGRRQPSLPAKRTGR